MNKIDKYDVSIVIPYYKKFDELRYALEYNYKQFEMMNEVIIIIDEYIENLDNFAYLKNYNINFKFYMNDITHEWRNPAVVINKGIKEAISKKIIILSPETIILENSLINLINNCDDTSFSVGIILFMSNNFYNTSYNYTLFDIFIRNPIRTTDIIGPVTWGSICCTKENFEKINYYTEKYSLNGWGGEDDNVRNKLENNKINKKIVLTSKFIHLESSDDMNKRYLCIKNYNMNFQTELYDTFNKIDIKGLDLQKFNYSMNEIKKIDNIKEYSLSENISSYYPIVLLTQCYNEEKNIKDYLINISRFVDAIIVLDDGSSDNSWNLLETNKLLIKFKVERFCFNDLRNRNLLLKVFENVLLKNNIKVDWFMWLDLDERLTDDQRFLNNIKQEILSDKFKPDIISLPLYHMWNDKEYNSEYPFSENGCQFKKRLIRNNLNKLPYILNSNNKLHFELNPYKGLEHNSFLQIKHLSYINKESRIRKYNLYTEKYDKEKCQNSYEHFLNDNIKLLEYNDTILYRNYLELQIKKKLGTLVLY